MGQRESGIDWKVKCYYNSFLFDICLFNSLLTNTGNPFHTHTHTRTHAHMHSTAQGQMKGKRWTRRGRRLSHLSVQPEGRRAGTHTLTHTHSEKQERALCVCMCVCVCVCVRVCVSVCVS